MNKFLFCLALLCWSFTCYSNGIVIVDGVEGTSFELVSSQVDVQVNNQVATVTATQVFRNNTGNDIEDLKYAFPMSGTASATQLRWNNLGEWFEADFSPTPQDTILPGDPTGEQTAFHIRQYLGDSPLYFNLTQNIPPNALLTVELTYVDLLPYAFNVVSFDYPNDYSLIQQGIAIPQTFNFTLNSLRTIEAVELASHTGATSNNTGNVASLNYTTSDLPDTDYLLEYELNADELGLFSFSTFLSDSAAICDGHGRGFLAFIVEPDPSENTLVIEKTFTLVIDRSGSMDGSKIVQARDAASFIVNNLNPGDKFNIVDFSGEVTAFSPTHVEYNLANETAALNYIFDINSGGGTNISGALETAISQFSGSSDEVANIIIFFTDGQATAGTTSTEGILNIVSNAVAQSEVSNLQIFTFGIGQGANQQLLTLLALQNGGISVFLGSDELQAVLSQFYLTIQNPVLLQTQMAFAPNIITETYPLAPLPNLFKGQQLIVVGRYEAPDMIEATFSGESFGMPISYNYGIDLAATSISEHQFLPRLWAKKRIEALTLQYYSQDPNSPEAMTIEEEIQQISLCYGVVSDFTSFEDNSGGGGYPVEVEDVVEDPAIATAHNHPNPFSDQTRFVFSLRKATDTVAIIKIYDTQGRLITLLEKPVNQIGEYEVLWNSGTLPTGVYLFTIEINGEILRGKLTKI